MLLNTPAGHELADRVLDPAATPTAPELLDVEVVQVLRRYARSGELDERRGRQAIDDLAGLPIERYAHGPFLGRAWELRDNLTAYDAVYVALAEALGAPLVTRDERLAASSGHRARIELD